MARATLPAVVDAVKALAHPGRLRILAMLRGGDLCVCQLTAVLELAASTVSSHLSDLRRAGLVEPHLALDGGETRVYVAEVGDLFQGGDDIVLGTGVALDQQFAQQSRPLLLVIKRRLQGFEGNALAFP